MPFDTELEHVALRIIVKKDDDVWKTNMHKLYMKGVLFSQGSKFLNNTGPLNWYQRKTQICVTLKSTPAIFQEIWKNSMRFFPDVIVVADLLKQRYVFRVTEETEF